jgi:hypothetical protein
VSNRNNKKKGRAPPTANASTTTAETRPIQAPTQSPHPALAQRRSVLVLFLEGLGILAAIATIAYFGGYALEKWQETFAVVDFSGDIDQKKPFSIPLVVKNPSSIFKMYLPQIDCWVDVEYVGDDPQKAHVLMAADKQGGAGAEIAPNGTGNFFCDMPDYLAFHQGDQNGSIVPIKQADMLVAIDYETWVPWTIKRHIVSQFVMLQTPGGFRWIKGQWMLGQQGVVWPPGSSPPWIGEKPKP